MTNRMTDEELGRAIMSVIREGTASETATSIGAAARRLVHEDDLRGDDFDLSEISKSILATVIEKSRRRDKAILWDIRSAATYVIKQLEPHITRLIAERDAAKAALSEMAMQAMTDFGQYQDWMAETERREHAAFQAGAEGMRNLCLGEAWPPASEIMEVCGPCSSRDLKVIRAFKMKVHAAIHALPLPAHQSTGDEK